MRFPAHVRPSRTLRARFTLEALEDRLLLAGDLFINAQVPGRGEYNLMHYTQAGAQVSSQPVLQAPGTTEYPDARGLSFGPFGNLHIYDGTFTPSLATLSPDLQSWSFQTYPGWSTVNNVSYGEVAAYNNFVFASDMFTFNGGEPNGIVRFDAAGGPAVRFAGGTDYIQLALGLDGKLYGLEGSSIHVFDPDTLASLRTFSLRGGPDSDIRGIAVDGSGQIFAATWGGYLGRYDTTGNYQSSIRLLGQFGFGENLINIALDSDGQIAVGGRFGEIYLSDESLTPAQTIQTNQWNVFVTFDHYIGTNLQVDTPSFDSLAGPTIPFGQPSVTLGGHISAGTAVPSGNVIITMAGVTRVAAINPADGTFSADFDTSTLDVSGSPYPIGYRYYGDATHPALDDISQTLTVTPASTFLSDLSSPTVVAGTPTVTLSGLLESNSVLPVGQVVTVTAIAADGTEVATGSGVVGSDGSFLITLDTSALAVGSYTLHYVYAGDANFSPSDDFGMLTVTP